MMYLERQRKVVHKVTLNECKKRCFIYEVIQQNNIKLDQEDYSRETLSVHPFGCQRERRVYEEKIERYVRKEEVDRQVHEDNIEKYGKSMQISRCKKKRQVLCKEYLDRQVHKDVGVKRRDRYLCKEYLDR